MRKSFILTFLYLQEVIVGCLTFFLVLLQLKDGTIGIGIATATVGLVVGGIAALVLKR